MYLVSKRQLKQIFLVVQTSSTYIFYTHASLKRAPTSDSADICPSLVPLSSSCKAEHLSSEVWGPSSQFLLRPLPKRHLAAFWSLLTSSYPKMNTWLSLCIYQLDCYVIEFSWTTLYPLCHSFRDMILCTLATWKPADPQMPMLVTSEQVPMMHTCTTWINL